ncbi:MAG: T9SS type A sorting domain-containing protein [Candidatus Marinimicrobia bacterium]|nr:T9SS type A sorting domain-containing protein [Candidatus Neomarinimicrobiota bacterium]
MKSRMLLLFVVLLSVTALFAQEKMLIDFETEMDSTTSGYNAAPLYYEWSENSDRDSCYAYLTWVDNPVAEGAKALRMDYRIQDSESWGGYHKLGFSKADSNEVFDFSGYDTLSFMYYIEEPSTQPLSFRVNITDCAESPDGNLADGNGNCEYYYSLNDNIVQNTPGVWYEQKIAIVSNGSWDGSAFNLTTWAGVVGNGVIDKDKIKSIDVELSIAEGISPTAHGVILLDAFKLTGAAKVDVTFFNGRALPANVTLSGGWGGGSVEITEEEDSYPGGGTTSIKYNTPPVENSWALWDGPVFTIKPPQNTFLTWVTDSLKFKIKADAGLDSLKIVLADDDMDTTAGPDLGYEAYYMLKEEEVGYDGTWKQVILALTDFDRNGGAWDASINASRYDALMDSTRLQDLKILIGSTNGLGKVIYLDDIVIGNPTFDLFPPAAPAGVSGIPYPSQYYNLVMWTDVDGESGEVYNVYGSTKPITDLTDPSVELIKSGVLEGTQAVAHYLKYPLVDGQLDYYYAVVCKDAAGNVGEPAFSDMVSGMGKGVATISLDVPATFVADGYLDEWYDSGIKPFVLKPETDFVVVGSMADSSDLKATVFIAVDNDYLYLAADVVDDKYYFSETNSWWCNDALDFFIGLYHQQGGAHAAYTKGNEPDHKMQFRADGFTDEITSGYTMAVGSEGYYFEGFDPDYVFEAKISLDSIKSGSEERFYPKNGMKIPIELYFHDNDEGSTSHESALGWSPTNTDHAWQSPAEWTYTFIGDQYGYVDIDDDENETIATSFSLEQNYPNPFNPTTRINYTLGKVTNVNISVYNMLGQKVTTLVNKQQIAGAHSIQWNAADVATGVYFYKIQAGDFTQTRKMLLMK